MGDLRDVPTGVGGVGLCGEYSKKRARTVYATHFGVGRLDLGTQGGASLTPGSGI